jgi:transposase-like protein
MAHVPKVAMRSEVARDLRRVFDADEPSEAERRLKDVVARYQKTAPQLAAWLEHAIPEAMTVLSIPAAHRRRLRTTNSLERLNKEIKRRTRVATLFPNEASLLRLASAVLSEISDDWETERAYLNMEA